MAPLFSWFSELAGLPWREFFLGLIERLVFVAVYLMILFGFVWVLFNR